MPKPKITSYIYNKNAVKNPRQLLVYKDTGAEVEDQTRIDARGQKKSVNSRVVIQAQTYINSHGIKKADTQYIYDKNDVSRPGELLVYKDTGDEVENQTVITLIEGNESRKCVNSRGIIQKATFENSFWVYIKTGKPIPYNEEPVRVSNSYAYEGEGVVTYNSWLLRYKDKSVASINDHSFFQKKPTKSDLKRQWEEEFARESKRAKVKEDIQTAISTSVQAVMDTNLDDETLNLIIKYHQFNERVLELSGAFENITASESEPEFEFESESESESLQTFPRF